MCCGALPCCLFDLPSFSSLIKTCTYHTRLYRLREKCMAILLLCCSYRRKAEELLWKKVFYDLVQKSKSNKQVRSMYMTAVGSSFHCGMGVQYKKFVSFGIICGRREKWMHALHVYMHHSCICTCTHYTCTCIMLASCAHLHVHVYPSHIGCAHTCPYTYTCTVLKAGHPGVPSYMYICLFVRDMVGWVILLSFLSYFFKLVCYAHVFPCKPTNCKYIHAVVYML